MNAPHPCGETGRRLAGRQWQKNGSGVWEWPRRDGVTPALDACFPASVALSHQEGGVVRKKKTIAWSNRWDSLLTHLDPGRGRIPLWQSDAARSPSPSRTLLMIPPSNGPSSFNRRAFLSRTGAAAGATVAHASGPWPLEAGGRRADWRNYRATRGAFGRASSNGWTALAAVGRR